MRLSLLAMSAVTAALAALLLLACSLTRAAPNEPACAVVLVTAADWPSAAVLADEAARRSGVAVIGFNAVSARIFALTLDCHSEADCLRAIDRLGADTRFAVDVQPERRRVLPPRPSASSAK